MAENSKKPHKKRKVFLDVILLEYNNVVPRRASGFLTSLFSKESSEPLVNAFCRMKVGEQNRDFSCKVNDRNPTWNEDATFTYFYADESELNLRIELIDQERGLLTTTDTVMYRNRIDLFKLPLDELVDTTFEVEAIPPPDRPFLAQNKATFAHLLIYKSLDPQKGLLKYHGIPLKSIPLRVDAGDIILVSSSYFLTHGIKVATQCKWDHVAMIVKLPGKFPYRLFEATSDGVATYYLNSAIETYLSSSVIAIRRLRMERTAEMRKALANFVSEVDGRPYKYNPWQLVKARMGTHDEDDLNSLFCSQLIGESLKKMEVLPHDLKSSNILPVHFDEREQLPEVVTDPISILFHSKFSKTISFSQVGPVIKNSRDISCIASKDEFAVHSVNISTTDSLQDSKGRKYTVYNIQIVMENGTGFLIQRRYSQFYELHVAMKKLFSGIPKVPPKTIGGNMSSKVVKARQQSLQIYLELLLDDTLTRKAAPLISFLSPGSAESDLVISDSEEYIQVVQEKRKRRKSSKPRKSADTQMLEKNSKPE